MHTLTVVTVEGGAVVASSPSGERYRIPIDESILAALHAAAVASPAKARMTPKEIQARIRAGESAHQVAAEAGTSLAAIERFVGPVLAELTYMLTAALAVRVTGDGDATWRTFGTVMGERFAALDAKDVRWSCVRESTGGWVLRVSFSADDIAHDARWDFDPKRSILTPQNMEAGTLSQSGPAAAFAPRLRVLQATAPIGTIIGTEPPARVEPKEADRSRFDSGVFVLPSLSPGGRAEDVETVALPVSRGQHAERRSAPTPPSHTPVPAFTAPNRTAPAFSPASSSSTSVLDERRDERDEPSAPVVTLHEPRPVHEAQHDERSGSTVPLPPEMLQHPAPRPAPPRMTPERPGERRPEHRQTGEAPLRGAFGQGVRPPGADRPTPGRFDDPLPPVPPRRARSGRRGAPDAFGRIDPAAVTDDGLPPTRPVGVTGPTTRTRRGRTSMPSWDEIVYGRDDD